MKISLMPQMARIGKNNPFYGRKHTEETKRKIGESRRQTGFTQEQLERVAQMGRDKKGQPNLKLRGRKVNPKQRETLLFWATGEKNVNWKGDDVSYRSLHKWIERIRGKPHFCEVCKKSDLKHRQYHWANKSGRYQRNVSDWIRLCVKCHKVYDR